MPNQYKTRTNKKCPDGMEHQMSNGGWMCGKIHKYEHGGGLLEGPSHENGGIPVIVGGNEPIELEGGEYIIKASAVKALGKDFLDKLNSTSSDGDINEDKMMIPPTLPGKRTKPKPTNKHNVRAKTYSKCVGGYMVNGKCVSAEKINTINNQRGPCPAGYTKSADGSCI